MKVWWSKIALLATAISAFLSSSTSQAQAQVRLPEQEQPTREESEDASPPIVCLGMGSVDDDSDSADRTSLSGASALTASWRKESALFKTQQSWKGIGLSSSESFSPSRFALERRMTAPTTEDEQAVLLPGMNAGLVCDVLSLGILASPLIATTPSGGTDQPTPSAIDQPSNIPDQNTPIDQGTPPGGGEAGELPKSDGKQPIDPAKDPEDPEKEETPTNQKPPVKPIPTPALLPGLIGLGVAAFRKHKPQATAD
jgi:hypothetical protein